MYENGFGINNLQWLLCHETKPNSYMGAVRLEISLPKCLSIFINHHGLLSMRLLPPPCKKKDGGKWICTFPKSISVT